MPEEETKKPEEETKKNEETQGAQYRYSQKTRTAAGVALILIVIFLISIFVSFGRANSMADAGAIAIMMIAFPFLLLGLLGSVALLMSRARKNRPYRIDTIVFDIGNVLADFTWKEWMESAGYDAETNARIAKVSFEDPVWNEIDRGVWTHEQLIDSFIEKDPQDADAIRKMFNRSFVGIVSKKTTAIPWIRALRKAGYRTLFLSNYSEIAYNERGDALDFLQEMDGGVFSYQEKLIKPDPAIYECLIERYGITPECAVFIDDNEANVRAANELGFHAIRYQSQAQAERALAELQVYY